MSTDATVGVVVFDGFEEMDAVGPYDVFQTAGREGAPVTTDLLAVEGTNRVIASKGLRVEPDGVLSVEDAPEYLVVPGGGWNSRAGDGAWAEAERGVLPDRIASCHEQGTTVASVCTGGMILDRAGLLDGRPAVTHGSALAELDEGEADVVETRVVDDGDVLTSGGVTSGIDMALWLVEREWGDDVADAVATELEHDRSQDVYRSE